MADKLPFDIRLANAIEKYKIMFEEHPRVCGYGDEELYILLLKSIKDKIELPGVEEKIKDVMDMEDNELVDI